MFGLPSLSKLLVLAAIIIAVWYGFKLLGRMDQQRKQQAKLREREDAGGGARRAPARETEAEEMVQCPACQAFVPARGARSCGRPDCPY